MYRLILLILLIATPCYAVMPSPPIMNDMDVRVQKYFKILYDRDGILDVTTVAPNGNRHGRVNEIVVYNNSGTYKIWINTDGNTAWSQL